MSFGVEFSLVDVVVVVVDVVMVDVVVVVVDVVVVDVVVMVVDDNEVVSELAVLVLFLDCRGEGDKIDTFRFES